MCQALGMYLQMKQNKQTKKKTLPCGMHIYGMC